ncbi:MAG: aminotransferase class V-fold PLP-dependent enzyme [Candidatus Njordarchaeia archaeon]
MDWDAIRGEFRVLENLVYLNTASVGLAPERAYKAAERWLNERHFGNIHWMDWYEEAYKTKELFAKLINADVDEIALVQNTTMALNFAANSINWEEGENIVTNDMEFPANRYIWQLLSRVKKLELRIAKNENSSIPFEKYEELVDEKTKAIAVSWVQFSNGFKHDLGKLSKLARDNGAYLIVDGIQGVGALKIDVKQLDIDFLACGGHKWLLGLPGSGFMYVNEKTLEKINPSFAGWLGDKNPFDFGFREYAADDTARVYELGSPSFIGYSFVKESLGLILDLGIERIEKRNLQLAKHLIELVEDRFEVKSPMQNCSPTTSIINLGVKDADRLAEHLMKKGIRVSVRDGGVRVSIDFYNNEEDLNILYENLRENLDLKEI